MNVIRHRFQPILIKVGMGQPCQAAVRHFNGADVHVSARQAALLAFSFLKSDLPHIELVQRVAGLADGSECQHPSLPRNRKTWKNNLTI